MTTSILEFPGQLAVDSLPEPRLLELIHESPGSVSPEDNQPVVTYFDPDRRVSAIADNHQRRIKELDVIKGGLVSIGHGSRRARLTAVYHGANGVGHELRITEPELYAPATSPIFAFPGCSESHMQGTAAYLHNSIAALHPGSQVITVASDGMNKYGYGLSYYDLLTRGLNDMAEDRLPIVQCMADGRKINLVGESMSAAILARLLKANLDSDNSSQADIDKTVFHSAALVPSEHTVARMAGLFPAHMMFDTMRESLMHPLQAINCWIPRRDAIRPKTWFALVGQIRALLEEGTEYTLLDEIADTEKIGILDGASDVLAEIAMLKRLESEHPDTVRFETFGGGHASGIDYLGAAKYITRMFTELDKLPGSGN